MKLFIVCPCCGYELLKAEDGSYIEITCPQCDAEIVIVVEDNKLAITIKPVIKADL